MGDIPIMTDKGTFVVNGAERVVVSQIHRSPGVIFSHEKGVFSSRIIPYRGSWLEFEIDQKKELIYAKIDRKKRILATIFLRALGYETRESIIELFYKIEKAKVADSREDKERLVGRNFARAVVVKDGDSQKTLYRAGDKVHPHDVEELVHAGVKEIFLIDFEHETSLHSPIILNCFEREDLKFSKETPEQDEISKDDAILRVYSIIKPGEPITIENAEKDLHSMFFSSRRYDLGRVGRYKLNKKFDYPEQVKTHTLVKEDIINTMTWLIRVYIGEMNVDDIDHLGNRRVRSVGELLTNQLKVAFTRMERIAKERMSLKEADTIKPQDLISIKPIVATIKEFFGSSQLSQFMDQVNPLAELTHKRRLNALGPGGLSRDRAGFEVRDVHYTHYGRMCPIETPEGPNIGLIVSLANYTRVNEYGFLETPYRKVKNGKVTHGDRVPVRHGRGALLHRAGQRRRSPRRASSSRSRSRCARAGTTSPVRPRTSSTWTSPPSRSSPCPPRSFPSSSTTTPTGPSWAPTCSARRCRSSSPSPPGSERAWRGGRPTTRGSWSSRGARATVVYVTSTEIRIRPDEAKRETGRVSPAEVPAHEPGHLLHAEAHRACSTSTSQTGEVIADGPATYQGELALGRNLLCAFMPWNGYNYEDAILVSEAVVQADAFSSIHIKEFSVEVRETKLGPEKITRDIPNTNEHAFEQLDEEGIIRVGATVKAGSILVGKVTPEERDRLHPRVQAAELHLRREGQGGARHLPARPARRGRHDHRRAAPEARERRRARPRRRGGREGPRRGQAEAPGGGQAGRAPRQQGRRRPGPARGGDALHGGRHADRHRAQSPGGSLAHEPRPDHGDRARAGRARPWTSGTPPPCSSPPPTR